MSILCPQGRQVSLYWDKPKPSQGLVSHVPTMVLGSHPFPSLLCWGPHTLLPCGQVTSPCADGHSQPQSMHRARLSGARSWDLPQYHQPHSCFANSLIKEGIYET